MKRTVRSMYIQEAVMCGIGLITLWQIDVIRGVPWATLLGFGDPIAVFGLGTLLAVILIGIIMVKWLLSHAVADGIVIQQLVLGAIIFGCVGIGIAAAVFAVAAPANTLEVSSHVS